jgi:hypothetical protein
MYSISQVFGVISISFGVDSQGYGDNSKGLGDKTNRKKTFNPTAGKV